MFQKSLSSEVVKPLHSQIPFWNRVGDRTRLKCLCRLEVSSHTKNWFCFESNAFVDDGVQESYFSIQNISLEFDCRVVFVCSFNELCYFSSVCVPEEEYVVYVAFPNERFDCALAYDLYYFQLWPWKYWQTRLIDWLIDFIEIWIRYRLPDPQVA